MKFKTEMVASNRKSGGFTLLELLATMAIATVFLTVVPSSFNSILTAVRLKSQMYDFNGALDFARSEAVKRGTYVTVCPSLDQATCGPSGTGWVNGWIVFVDSNNNQTLDNTEGSPLRTAAALISNYSIKGTAATTLHSYITFDSKGRSSASGVFILCKSGAINPSRAILIAASGRITPAQDHNGVPMDSSGADMTTCTP
jgi:type IV fimbrial biogenesis protein FimT